MSKDAELKADSLRLQNDVTVVNLIVRAQEEERQRLAREIHDGPAQLLANTIFEIEYCIRLLEKNPAALKGQLDSMGHNLREGLEDVRRFIFDLRPPSLAEQGLMATLRRVVRDYPHRFGIEVVIEGGLELRLPSTQEVAIFRILQEALHNITKHAEASRVDLCFIERSGHLLEIVIRDNGKGFDTAILSKKREKHLGVVSMRERAEIINAAFHLESAPGKGTTITIQFLAPLKTLQHSST